MKDIWRTLRETLSREHRQLAEGLRDLITAVRHQDFADAAALADDLDRRSGPHVEFEERYVFPVVEEASGEAYATRLYEEHAELITTLSELRRLTEHSRPDATARRSWVEQLEKGLSHIDRTHALLAHLSASSPARKTQLVQRHQRLHRRGHRWSQLHPIASPNG